MTRKEERDFIAVRATSPLTKREVEMYELLKDTFPEYTVLSQVDFKRVVGRQDIDKQTYMKEVGRLSLDFVILDRKYKPVACIELNDTSHDQPRTMYNDELKKHYLKSAEIHLLHCRKMPTAEKLKKVISHIEKKRLELGAVSGGRGQV